MSSALSKTYESSMMDTYEGAHISFDPHTIDILLVEDSMGDMIMARKALNACDVPYKLNHLRSGYEVLPYLYRAMHSHMPDVILLDIGLPGINGFEILAAIAEAPPLMRSSPIVLLTSYAGFGYIDKVYDLPIYGYLCKPVAADKMKEVISLLAQN